MTDRPTIESPFNAGCTAILNIVDGYITKDGSHGKILAGIFNQAMGSIRTEHEGALARIRELEEELVRPTIAPEEVQ